MIEHGGFSVGDIYFNCRSLNGMAIDKPKYIII
jgi:hypothetical protein